MTAGELQSAYSNAKTIDGYDYLHGIRDEQTGQQIAHNVKRVISGVFALDSDLAVGGKTELQRYKELHPHGDSPIKMICVAGRGYWFFDNPEWHFVPADPSHRETVSFIAGLLHKLPEVSLSRRNPDLAGYLVGAAEIQRGVG